MRKVVCDRCKAEMMDGDERLVISLTKVNGTGYEVGESLDLCPRCGGLLREFLEGKKQAKNEVQAKTRRCKWYANMVCTLVTDRTPIYCPYKDEDGCNDFAPREEKA